MKHALTLTGLSGLTLLTAGCASQTTRYPSLLPRAIESRDNAEPVSPPPPVAAIDPVTEALLTKYRAALDETNKAFTAAADNAEATAHAARGDAVGIERWITAQTGLAELDGYRATLSATLTDIEQLAIDRAAAGQPDYPGLEALRGTVQAALDAETTRIGAIEAMLRAA